MSSEFFIYHNADSKKMTTWEILGCPKKSWVSNAQL